MTAVPARRDWIVVGQGAAAFAGAMGVGRFAYTPILPLMVAHAGMSKSLGASVATANYAGYLAGALACILVPWLLGSRAVWRGSLIVGVVSLALMPISHDGTVWSLLRFVAGVTSAFTFLSGANSLAVLLRGKPAALTGWAFGGVGIGIATSGLVVLVLRSVSTWEVAWLVAAAAGAVFGACAWSLGPFAPTESTGGTRAHAGRFGVLTLSYFLEGLGYIISGTFLVAAINQRSADWVGTFAWVVVGLAALPSAALYQRLSVRFARVNVLTAILLLQAIGIALPAQVDGIAPAMVSAALFGTTFLGAVILSLGIGTELSFPRSTAILTAAYGVGQILGPLVVTPLLHHGYHQALLIGAAVVLCSTEAAAVLRLMPFTRGSGSAAPVEHSR